MMRNSIRGPTDPARQLVAQTLASGIDVRTISEQKAAVAYLAASGAAAITIIENDGVCTISTGKKTPEKRA